MRAVKKVISVLLISLLFAGYAVFSYGQEQTGEQDEKSVVATGTGSIIQNDVAHARDDAIREALRRCVEQTLGMLIESETLVKNFQVIDDNIMSKTRGYVKNYQVVRERKRDQYLYEVTVQATVKVADIENDLEGIQSLMRRKNTPRMMVIIDEQNIGEAPGSFSYLSTDLNTAENTIMNDFMDKGFKFVDQRTIEKNLNREKAAAILKGDVSEAASLARAIGAEVIITGKAVAKSTVVEAFGAKQKSQQATVSVKAIRADTGDILGSAMANGAYPHIDDVVGGTKAIAKASRIVSEQIMKKILDKWQEDLSSGGVIVLKVKGVIGFTTLTKLKRFLSTSLRGVKSVSQRDWYNGFATLEVVVTENADRFAERLDGQKVSDYKIKVTGISQNVISISFISAAY